MLYDTELKCAEDTFSILMILALLYDHTGKKPAPHTIFDADYVPEIYFEALEYVAEECERGENTDFDTFVKYQFPGMCEYYALCREHSRKNGIAFKNDPYVKEAERTVYEALQSINSYCFDWRLFTPVKETEKKYPCLLFVTSPEFWCPPDQIEAFIRIGRFYTQGVDRLKKELTEETTIRVLPPAAVTEERKAA